MPSISIVGIGRLGGALAIALSRSGYRLETLVHRDGSTARAIAPHLSPKVQIVDSSTRSPIGSEIVLIATADPDIRSAADEIRDRLKPGSIVLHTSGSLSSDVLSALASAGHSVGSMHPLVSVSDAVAGGEGFEGAYFCIEGDEVALDAARSVVEALGGRPFSIAAKHKALYHAAAVTACGHLVALIDVAIEMLSNCGVDDAKEVLLPLIKSTITNLETQTTAKALTGSFARVDSAAVERHLASMPSAMSPLAREIYLLLGERSLDLAASNEANSEALRELREVISIAKRKTE